jgi:hypothetical protein
LKNLQPELPVIQKASSGESSNSNKYWDEATNKRKQESWTRKVFARVFAELDRYRTKLIMFVTW